MSTHAYVYTRPNSRQTVSVTPLWGGPSRDWEEGSAPSLRHMSDDTRTPCPCNAHMHSSTLATDYTPGRGHTHLLISSTARSYSCWKESDEWVTLYGLKPALPWRTAHTKRSLTSTHQVHCSSQPLPPSTQLSPSHHPPSSAPPTIHPAQPLPPPTPAQPLPHRATPPSP